MDLLNYAGLKMSTHEQNLLEKHGISSIDLLSLDAQDLARRTTLSISAIHRITSDLVSFTRPDTQHTALDRFNRQRFLTTGDANLDELMGGGAPVGHITEFVGESGVGKSQFMTQFCVTTQMPVSLGGLAKESVYISTESGLATSRAREMAAGIKDRFKDYEFILPPRPLDSIHVVVCPDLELQDHMLYYQLPVLLKQKRGKIGSVIIDSIAANYRAEHEGRHIGAAGGGSDKRAGDMAVRTKELTRLSMHLRKLAVDYNLAIIVANQVSDRISNGHDADILSLDHQSQWFNGWMTHDSSPKSPALGLVWANAVHCRVALKKTKSLHHGSTAETSREMKVVFSPFVKSGQVDYRIDLAGVKSI